ncbi:MAG: DUF4263 domain-containing protein [Syntrophales bacterium]|nr:DUF4263 domain-containing protein [Syntrophales bacterium]
MSDLKIKSTSRASAECSDLVIRETGTTRLVFRPLLVQNDKNPQASVKGTFLFQKKGFAEDWSDIPTEPLSGLKKGESYKLAFSSSEILALYHELTNLYQLYASEGIPRGEQEFTLVKKDLADLARIPAPQLQRLLKADQATGSTLLSNLLEWAAMAHDIDDLIKLLINLGPDSLRKLNTAVGVQNLKMAYALWRENRSNPDEEFWQTTLTENSYVLEYVFSWPCTIFKGKAYVGGKNIENKEGKIVDFLMKNRITKNAAIIEIKTPQTPLTGPRYRGVVNISNDLSGSVLQILDYKQTLCEHYHSLTHGQLALFTVFDPTPVVIIGDAGKGLRDKEEKKTFELFRNQMANVRVITFDELFEKTSQLISTLENSSKQDDNVPF